MVLTFDPGHPAGSSAHGRWFLDRPGLGHPHRAPPRRRLAGHRADRPRRGDRLRRDRVDRRAARGRRRRAEPRPLPAPGAVRPAPLRLRRRSDQLEALDVPALDPADRRPAPRHGRHLRAGPDRPAATRLLRRPGLRGRRPPGPGPGPGRRRLPDEDYYARRERTPDRRGPVHDQRVDLLLHLDGHRARDQRRRRHRPDRARRRVPGRPGHDHRAPASSSACRSARRAPSSSTRRPPRSPRPGPGSATRSPPTGLHDRLHGPARQPALGGDRRALHHLRATAPWPARPASARASPSGPTWPATRPITERSWDSCFSPGFAQVAGGSYRSRPRDRYRQWLTHKFATLVGPVRQLGLRRLRPLHHLVPGRDRRPRGAPGRSPRRSRCTVTSNRKPVAATPNDFVTAKCIATKRETADTSTLDPGRRRPGLLERQLRPVRDGLAAGLPAAPDLDLALHPRRDRADDPGRRTGDQGHGRDEGRATRSACADRSATTGRSTGRSGATSSSSPAGSGSPRSGRSSRRSSPNRRRFGDVRLYYGARTRSDLLYRPGSRALGDRATGSRSCSPSTASGPEWLGRVGVVTQLFDQALWDGSNAVAFVCGPERMMQATAATLAGRGVLPSRTFVTLERHMECGIGLCGHCQMGATSSAGTAPSSRSPSSATSSAGRASDGPVQAATVRTPGRRRQVRLVRRLPAHPPRPRGRAARARRALRHRRVPRGDHRPRSAGPYDVLLVEGSISAPEQADQIVELRAPGRGCSSRSARAPRAGGIQALRNWTDHDAFRAAVYAAPRVRRARSTGRPRSPTTSGRRRAARLPDRPGPAASSS